MAESCERCGGKPKSKIDRFCKKCAKTVLSDMFTAGYLETGGFGRKGQNRTSEMKELTHETKHGTGQG